jgi:hypothetical protein
MVSSKELHELIVASLGDISIGVDGVERHEIAWEDWAITTWIDASDHWQAAWQACLCHQSQLPGFENAGQLPEESQRRIWRNQTYYRAFSLVNGGRAMERDLFEGLR